MKSLYIALLSFLVLCQPVLGQDAVQVSEDKVNELIETLESETSRQQFIDNLKTMVEADNQETEEEAALGLGLGNATDNLISRYETFLADQGLNEDNVSRLLATGIIILGAFFVGFIVRKISHFIRDKMHVVRDKYNLRHDRFRLYARGLRYIGYFIITLLTLYSIGIVWELTDQNAILSEGSRTLIINAFNIFVVIAIGILVWETINTALEHYLQKLDGINAARLRTVIPIIRNVLFVAFVILFTLVLLSEIGINVLPLLAGAGVLGIAIGFGAQTMVKDFLTGFTIILEDLIQVGDVARVGDRIGLVERITIRKVQLRDLSGIVYTVPFSEISIVENWTKEFSYYIFDVGIAYREDVDEVTQYLREIDEEMRNDENYKNLILEPIEILGVDKFADSAVVIKARIKTLPIKQWEVGREFNRRMKYKFDEHNVEIPFPHQTLYFGHNKDGSAPAAPVELLNGNQNKK